MKLKDRIIELRRVPASELIPNPKNWRKHPEAQQNAMRGILAEVGIADAVLARETPKGLMLIDGHLRADIDPTVEWPVLVLDVTEAEADKILATHDPLAAMDQLEELYQRIVTKVFDGGLAKWDKEAGKKKILRNDLLHWFAGAVADAVHPGYHGTGKKLEAKLRDAGIPDDQYEAIAFLRLQYRNEGLTPKYAELQPRKQVECDIYAKLHSLRTKLDGKEIEEDGRAFHARCIAMIDEVRRELPEVDRPPAENLYGYMYNLADRCVHRFMRAKT